MRAPTAIVLLSAIGTLACANRGMHAPGDGGGPGAGGTVATAGRGGGGGQSGSAGRGGGAATAGTGGGAVGTAGTTGAGGQCNIAADAGASGGSGGACAAMFNFESGTQGAMINAGSTAFMAIAKSGASTYCGSGALAITAMFSGTSGATTKGEVLINLPGAPIDLTGKTITVHVAADPGCSADLNLSLVLNTTAGPYYFTPLFPIRPVTSMWKTQMATVTADAGSTMALALSLQAFSQSGYQGTIYIDEVDVR